MAAKKKKKEETVTVSDDETLMDFKEFDYDELFVLQDQLSAHIEARKAEQQDLVRSKIEELAADNHMSIEELQALMGQKKKKPPKYRNPDNAKQAWVGHGRKPSWLQEFLDDGRELEDFLIEKV